MSEKRVNSTKTHVRHSPVALQGALLRMSRLDVGLRQQWKRQRKIDIDFTRHKEDTSLARGNNNRPAKERSAYSTAVVTESNGENDACAVKNKGSQFNCATELANGTADKKRFIEDLFHADCASSNVDPEAARKPLRNIRKNKIGLFIEDIGTNGFMRKYDIPTEEIKQKGNSEIISISGDQVKDERQSSAVHDDSNTAGRGGKYSYSCRQLDSTTAVQPGSDLKQGNKERHRRSTSESALGIQHIQRSDTTETDYESNYLDSSLDRGIVLEVQSMSTENGEDGRLLSVVQHETPPFRPSTLVHQNDTRKGQPVGNNLFARRRHKRNMEHGNEDGAVPLSLGKKSSPYEYAPIGNDDGSTPSPVSFLGPSNKCAEDVSVRSDSPGSMNYNPCVSEFLSGDEANHASMDSIGRSMPETSPRPPVSQGSGDSNCNNDLVHGKKNPFAEIALQSSKYNGVMTRIASMNHSTRSLNKSHDADPIECLPMVGQTAMAPSFAAMVNPPEIVKPKEDASGKEMAIVRHMDSLDTEHTFDITEGDSTNAKSQTSNNRRNMNIGYRLGYRRTLFERRKRLSDYALIFGMFGIIVMVIETELSGNLQDAVSLRI